jgi:hypothetical protein
MIFLVVLLSVYRSFCKLVSTISTSGSFVDKSVLFVALNLINTVELVE